MEIDLRGGDETKQIGHHPADLGGGRVRSPAKARRRDAAGADRNGPGEGIIVASGSGSVAPYAPAQPSAARRRGGRGPAPLFSARGPGRRRDAVSDRGRWRRLVFLTAVWLMMASATP